MIDHNELKELLQILQQFRVREFERGELKLKIDPQPVELPKEEPQKVPSQDEMLFWSVTDND